MTNLLDVAAAHAFRYLESLSSRPIARMPPSRNCDLPFLLLRSSHQSEDVIKSWFAIPKGTDWPTGWFFGWVIGGTLVALPPTGLSAWDQNGIEPAAPAEATEEVCGEWMGTCWGTKPLTSFVHMAAKWLAHCTTLRRDTVVATTRVGRGEAWPLGRASVDNTHHQEPPRSILRSARLWVSVLTWLNMFVTTIRVNGRPNLARLWSVWIPRLPASGCKPET